MKRRTRIVLKMGVVCLLIMLLLIFAQVRVDFVYTGF
jgi:hypothetical protein